MKRIMHFLSLLLIFFSFLSTALAQSHTDKVRQFERLLHEWKYDGYSTGSEKYTQLMFMVTEGCRMRERVAKSYVDENNASTFDIRHNTWFEYLRQKKISISFNDLRETDDVDGKRIVYCWAIYTQPGKSERKDLVGFKFDGEKIFYIFNDDREGANRIKAERNDIIAPFSITSCTVSNVDYDGNSLPLDASHTQYLKPEIKYTCNTSGSYDIYVKFYDANGNLSTNNSSPSGYSLVNSGVSLSSGSGSKKLKSWGSKTSGRWRAGNYRYEFYYNGTLLYTHRFSVPEGQRQSSMSDLDKLSAYELYDKGREYLHAEDYANAIPYLRKAAEKGYSSAQVDLGWCYSTGHGVTENREEAIKWYRKSAEQGNATAQANLGWKYVSSDDNEAAKWFKKAADQGFVNSVDIYNQLAYYAAQGRGLPKSFEQAHKYIDKAISLDPNYWNYYDSKGEIYLMEGNISKAREYYNKCVRMYSNYSSKKSELWKYFNK